MDTIGKTRVLKQFLTGLMLVLAGFVLGNLGHKHALPKILRPDNRTNNIRFGINKYTNPLLECDENQGAFTELTPFKNQISEKVSALEQTQEISSISVYFRDMNNGPWFGVNQDATFSPASLLKVPLAIAYYKLNENDPGILNKSIVFKGPDSSWPKIQQSILPAQRLQIGKSYTTEELIERMLSYSDNEAYYILFSNINFQSLAKIYQDFALDINGPSAGDDSIVSVKGYSSFFRILFNASYLNQKDSEKILSFLANTDFKDGLVAAVPSNISVSHKFGEREIADSGLEQLHDCGITYYPNHPYLLCIMTKGTDISKEAAAIQQIGALIYLQVSSQVNKNN